MKEDIPEFWARVTEMQDDQDVTVRRQVSHFDRFHGDGDGDGDGLSLIHNTEPTRQEEIS